MYPPIFANFWEVQKHIHGSTQAVCFARCYGIIHDADSLPKTLIRKNYGPASTPTPVRYGFVPPYDIEDAVREIRIIVEGIAGHVPTALVALTVHDALNICDTLNRRLGYDREA